MGDAQPQPSDPQPAPLLDPDSGLVIGEQTMLFDRYEYGRRLCKACGRSIEDRHQRAKACSDRCSAAARRKAARLKP